MLIFASNFLTCAHFQWTLNSLIGLGYLLNSTDTQKTLTNNKI